MVRFSVDLPEPGYERLVRLARQRGVTLHDEAARLLAAALEGTEPVAVELELRDGQILARQEETEAKDV